METSAIAELIERVTTGDPWHGSNVAQLLNGVSAADAARRPAAAVHSIWEIVLHMTGWAAEVRNRLAGGAAQDPEVGDWPEVGAVTEERWEAAKRALFEAHRELAAAVRALETAALDQPVVDFRPVDPTRGALSGVEGPPDVEGRDRAMGIGLSKYLTLHGLIHHTVYHSGQIGLLRKLL
jgi:hypothetical protein